MGPCVINNSRFSDNYCKDTGGAIFNFGEVYIYITGCVFTNNKADFVGGTIHNVGYLNLNNSIIFNSSSIRSDGGAIQNDIYGDDIGNAIINNLTVINSSALKRGGAIFNNAEQYLNLTNSTFINCQAREGNVLYNIAKLDLYNNLIYDSDNPIYTTGELEELY